MKRSVLCLVAILCSASALYGGDGAATDVAGSYVEVRSADVFVGACFANSEAGFSGKEATLAWKIERGSFEGVPMDGLSVVAVVRGHSTLGDPLADPSPIQSVLVFDERATTAQRNALRRFVRTSAGPVLGTVVREETAPIRFERRRSQPDDHHHVAAGSGVLQSVEVSAGSIVALQTRPFRESDHLCGNAEICYLPLFRDARGALPVFAERMVFRGEGLGAQWSIPNKLSGYVADFRLDTGSVSEARLGEGHEITGEWAVERPIFFRANASQMVEWTQFPAVWNARDLPCAPARVGSWRLRILCRRRAAWK